MRAIQADASKGHSRGGWPGSPRALQGALLLAFALTLPALGRAQQASSGIPSSAAPGTSAPGGSVPAAELPGASLPGAAMPIPGLTGAAATGLSPMPAEYTSYGASVGAGASDNVDLSATNRKASGLAATNLFFDLIRSGSRLELSALGNFSDIYYLQHSYGNQVLGRFDGLANGTLWKDHLKWLVRDDYGDSQIDVLQSLTPHNLQRVNVFSTGPDLTLQPTRTSFVEAQAIYSRINYQSSPFNGESESGSLSVGHQFSPAASISLVGQVQQQRFDNRTINTDYQIREYYLQYKLKGARTTVDLQGGLNQADVTGSWKSSPLVRLAITRNISEFSTISLAGGRAYQSAAGRFASLSAVSGGIPVGPGTQTTEAALRTYGTASWGFHRLRTTLNFFGGWEREAYARQSKFGNTRTNVGLSLGRTLTPRLSANLTLTANRSRYASQGFTDTYGTLGGGLTYRPGAWVVLYGRYDHQFRRSSGVTRGLGYDENRVFIMIGYYPHSSSTGTPGQGGMGMGGMM